MVCPNLNS